jgi:peptidoglycan/xylan/chitin deacetylase (PgdA/CDA1 family)
MPGIKRAIIRHLRHVPFAAALLQRMAGRRFVTFCAHVVSEERLPHIRHLFSYRTPRQFESDLDMLLKIRRPIGLDDLVAAIRAGISPPSDACLLTFDDGLREAGEIIAPILKRRGIPAAFFVNSDFVDNRAMFFRHKGSLIVEALRGKSGAAIRHVADALAAEGIGVQPLEPALLERSYGRRAALDGIAESLDLDLDAFLKARQPYLRLEDIRAMARDGFAIGAHSRSHPLFAELPYDEQREQALSSIDFVRRNIAPANLAFAFPFHDGGVSERLFADMASAGVGVSFGTAGLRRDAIAWNVHRIPAEDAASDVQDDLTVACAKSVLYRMVGRGMVRRPRLPVQAGTALAVR